MYRIDLHGVVNILRLELNDRIVVEWLNHAEVGEVPLLNHIVQALHRTLEVILRLDGLIPRDLEFNEQQNPLRAPFPVRDKIEDVLQKWDQRTLISSRRRRQEVLWLLVILIYLGIGVLEYVLGLIGIPDTGIGLAIGVGGRQLTVIATVHDDELIVGRKPDLHIINKMVNKGNRAKIEMFLTSNSIVFWPSLIDFSKACIVFSGAALSWPPRWPASIIPWWGLSYLAPFFLLPKQLANVFISWLLFSSSAGPIFIDLLIVSFSVTATGDSGAVVFKKLLLGLLTTQFASMSRVTGRGDTFSIAQLYLSAIVDSRYWSNWVLWVSISGAWLKDGSESFLFFDWQMERNFDNIVQVLIYVIISNVLEIYFGLKYLNNVFDRHLRVVHPSN